MKVGEITIPHFAHKKDNACTTFFSEGESREHLQGKQHLYTLLKKHATDVKLEPFLHRLSQRPDLLVTTQFGPMPIEFQCSTISVSDMESRSAGYRSMGMTPIWILHTPAKFTTLPQGVGIFHFSRFHESFFTHIPPEGSMLLTYHPITKRFHYFSSLLHVAGKRYIGIHRSLRLEKQIFPFAWPKAPTQLEISRYAAIYLSTRHHFLQSRILLNRKGVNDPFLRICYEMRVLPTNLPCWIGVPVPFSDAFREHDCEWQLKLIYYMRLRQIRTEDLSDHQLWRFVGGGSEEQVKACTAYRDFLLQVGVESLQKRTGIDEQTIISLISERFLAKRYEN